MNEQIDYIDQQKMHIRLFDNPLAGFITYYNDHHCEELNRSCEKVYQLSVNEQNDYIGQQKMHLQLHHLEDK